jgi:hypothetical protein
MNCGERRADLLDRLMIARPVNDEDLNFRKFLLAQ